MSFSIDFHATREELIDLVLEWMSYGSAYTYAVSNWPFCATPLQPEEAGEVISDPRTRDIVFCMQQLETDVPGDIELLEQCPTAMILSLGRLREGCLEASNLGSLKGDDVWKEMVKSLKKNSTAGVFLVDDRTGDTTHYRNHRITEGAKIAYGNGVVLRDFAQQTASLHPKDEQKHT